MVELQGRIREIDLVAQVRYTFGSVKPKNSTFGTFQRGTEEGDHYRSLNDAIRHVFYSSRIPLRSSLRLCDFTCFAEDKCFINLVMKKPIILDVMRDIEEVYFKLITPDGSVSNFVREHILSLTSILNAKYLNDDEFYSRAVELLNNLKRTGMTFVSDEVKNPKLYKEKEGDKERQKEFYHLVYGNSAKVVSDSKKARSIMAKEEIKKIELERAKRLFYQPILDIIRSERELLEQGSTFQLYQNPDSKYLPQLILNIKDYLNDHGLSWAIQDIIKKIITIFRNSSTYIYKKFISSLERRNYVKNALLEDMINRSVAKNNKKPIKFEFINLDSNTIRHLTTYFFMDRSMKNTAILLQKRYAKSLKELIDEAYEHLLKTPGALN